VWLLGSSAESAAIAAHPGRRLVPIINADGGPEVSAPTCGVPAVAGDARGPGERGAVRDLRRHRGRRRAGPRSRELFIVRL
jgi:hypothetical protein